MFPTLNTALVGYSATTAPSVVDVMAERNVLTLRVPSFDFNSGSGQHKKAHFKVSST